MGPEVAEERRSFVKEFPFSRGRDTAVVVHNGLENLIEGVEEGGRNVLVIIYMYICIHVCTYKIHSIKCMIEITLKTLKHV